MLERHRETIPPYAGLARFQSLLTDASVHDDERVGQGHAELKLLGYYWVAVRVRAIFLRKPLDEAALAIETWANPPVPAAIDRNYRLSDSSGTFAVGAARWALVRLADGYPVRLANVPWLVAARTFEAEKVFMDDLPAVRPFTSERPYAIDVPVSGIDKNGHLNNARYWDLVFAAADRAGAPRGDVAAIDITYAKALYAGESAVIHLRREDERIAFSAYVERDGENLLAFRGTYLPMK